jgi:magnesium transporter
VFDPVRQRLQAEIGNIRELGPDYLLYALIDVAVDHYFLSLESLGERIESLDEQAANDPTPAVLAEIRALKREMIVLRRSVWPLREVVDQLERGDLRLVKKSTRLYFRSVYNHVIQVMDAVDAYREILAVMIDIYLSGVNNRMTAVMNTLTIISTIFLPLTFIAGVYGMNFHYMPELTWRWGYPAIWGVMILLSIAMLIYFRRRRWL